MVQSGLALDPRADDPIFRQIFDQLAERIRTGAYPAGFRLPPTRALARELGTHRNTIVRAYADLASAGFVVSTVGRGTFVATLRVAEAPAPPGRASARPRAPSSGPRLPAGVDAAIPWEALMSRAARAEPLGRVHRLVRQGPLAGDVVNLTRMQPSADLLPHDLLRRCLDFVLRTRRASALTYAPPEGLPRLRERIAEDLARQGVPVAASDIVVTTGSQQAIDLLARALLDPGDTLLLDGATYTGAVNLFTLAGAHLVPVPVDAEGPELSGLERLASSAGGVGRVGVKGLYVMPNYSNPTGAVMSSARRHALVRWARAAKVPLIEDDYGADLRLSSEPAPPALRALDRDVLYLSTFSKRLIPALRVGFCAVPPKLLPAVVGLKHALDLGTSLVMQHALAEFMERGYLRAHVSRVVAEYGARRDALEAALARHLPRSVTWRHPESGVVLWVELPPDVDPEGVYEESRRRGVLVSPASLFAVEGHVASGVRLSFCGEPPHRLAVGAKRFADAVRAVLARSRRAPAGAGAVGLV